MPEEKFTRMKLGLQIIQTLGIVIAVLSLSLNYMAVHDQHEWNRRQQTFVLLNELNKQLKEIREPLRNACPDLYSEAGKIKLSQADAENLINACWNESFSPGRKFKCDDRNTVFQYLNYLEQTSVAYLNHIADRSMIETTIGGLIVEDYDYFENVVKVTERIKGRSAWKPLQDTVTDLKHRKTSAAPLPTGHL